MHADQSHSGGLTDFLRSRTGLVLLGFLAVADFFLVTEHTAHFFGAALPANGRLPADARVHARWTWRARRSVNQPCR